MNETGKAARSSVEGEASESTTPAADGSDTAAVVFEMVRQVAQGKPIELSRDTPLTELGLTSLERMEVLGLVEERFGGRFPEMVLIDGPGNLWRGGRGGGNASDRQG